MVAIFAATAVIPAATAAIGLSLPTVPRALSLESTLVRFTGGWKESNSLSESSADWCTESMLVEGWFSLSAWTCPKETSEIFRLSPSSILFIMLSATFSWLATSSAVPKNQTLPSKRPEGQRTVTLSPFVRPKRSTRSRLWIADDR